jgi:hypothetical protein
MKKYSIEEVCKELGITRQMVNVKCRKMKIEKEKVGRRSYISSQQLKMLRGGKTSTTPKKSDTGTADGSVSVDERLIERLVQENDYLKKKLDEEGDKVKGSLNVIFQQTERITKLETENTRLLPYAPPDVESEEIPIDIDKNYNNESLHDKKVRGEKVPWWSWWVRKQQKGRR